MKQILKDTLKSIETEAGQQRLTDWFDLARFKTFDEVPFILSQRNAVLREMQSTTLPEDKCRNLS